MLTRSIPSTGEVLPVIGLGRWRAFDVGTDEAARRPLREVLRLFLDAGGRIIDSSPMYGRAEAVTGDLLAELPGHQRPFLATKVWTTGAERGAEQMRRSAQLLRSEVIDLMQIHNPVDWPTHLASLRRMKDDGHIRYIGITHYTTGALPELARILASEPGIDFGLGAVEGLDLALFVDRQHHGMRRRIDIEPDNVGELVGKAGIARAFEGAQPVGLQFVRPPDALYRPQRDTGCLGHRPAGPVGRLVRRFGAEPAPAKAGVSATTRAVASAAIGVLPGLRVLSRNTPSTPLSPKALLPPPHGRPADADGLRHPLR